MTIEPLNNRNWPVLHQQIMSIESTNYEPARRDSRRFIEQAVLETKGVSFVAVASEVVAGFCVSGPLEQFRSIRGLDDDPTLDFGSTLYAADICVARRYQSQGIGRNLKEAQIHRTQNLDYSKISVRNRVGMAGIMWKLNQSLGAQIVAIMNDVYKDGLKPDQCIYYHIKV